MPEFIPFMPKDDPRDKIEIELGDSKQQTFYPQLKFMRWDNEANYSVRLFLDKYFGAQISIDGQTGKVVWRKGNNEVHFYELKESENLPNGGFEFEIILYSKPVSNIFEFSILAKDVDFFYQPKTVAEPNGHRPDHIKGSYAVYSQKGTIHEEGGKFYRAGKVGHIHRPKAVDDNGDWIWCDLNIDAGLMTVTVPQLFLDSASYPVKVDPTFGNEGEGGSSAGVGAAEIYSSGAGAPASSGTVTNLHIYGYTQSESDVTVGLYDDDTGPNSKVGTEKETVDFTDASPAGWMNFSTNELSVTGSSTYWPSADSDVSLVVYYDVVGGTNRYFDVHTYGVAWPATHAQDTSSGAKYSMYCTYTAAGYTLTAAQGSYSLSGQAASPLADRKIAADQGSYSLSGQATALLRGYLVTATQGSYSLSGQDAGLLADRLIAAAQGSYSLTGQDADLLLGHLLTADQGSYSLTGQAVTLTYTPVGGYTIVAESGSYALSGQAVSVLTERLLTADQGSYTLSGQATEILKGFYISAAQGNYTLTGQAASLLVDYVIALDQGSYTLTGFTSLLDYSGVVTVRGMKDNLHRLRYDRINALGRSPSKRYNRLRGRPWRG